MVKKEENKTEKEKKKSIEQNKSNKKDNIKSSTKKKATKPKKEKQQKNHFMKDVKNELKKVRWPLKKEMITYSIATLVFIIILGLFFVATDLIIAGIRMVFV